MRDVARSVIPAKERFHRDTESQALRPLWHVPEPVPIADYAAIGCTRSVALVSRGGSIDWLCWPRFDSPSIFGRLLDIEKGGCFAIHPAIEHESRRQYLDGTNVIETTFTTKSGTAKLLDLMPVMTEEEKRSTLTPFRQLLRRIEVIDGEMPIEVLYAPRPDYARITPRLQQRGDSIHCGWGARVLNLRSDANFEIDDGTAVARFTLKAGESRTFALGYDDHTPAVLRRSPRRHRTHRQVLARVVVATGVRRSTSRARPSFRARPETADVRADRRHHRRADHVAPRVDRQRPQLGLSLLLAARCVLDRDRAFRLRLLEGRRRIARLAALLHASHASASADGMGTTRGVEQPVEKCSAFLREAEVEERGDGKEASRSQQ